jgi:endonuclease YncB( thermonuclease family)
VNDLPDLYNLAAKVERLRDADTFELTVSLGYDLVQRTHVVRPKDIDAAETWRPDTEEEREIGEAQTEWAEEWFETAREEYDGTHPLIFDSQEWKTDGWERSLGYVYRRSDGAEYTEDFLEEWGEEYRYER